MPVPQAARTQVVGSHPVGRIAVAAAHTRVAAADSYPAVAVGNHRVGRIAVAAAHIGEVRAGGHIRAAVAVDIRRAARIAVAAAHIRGVEVDIRREVVVRPGLAGSGRCHRSSCVGAPR